MKRTVFSVHTDTNHWYFSIWLQYLWTFSCAKNCSKSSHGQASPCLDNECFKCVPCWIEVVCFSFLKTHIETAHEAMLTWFLFWPLLGENTMWASYVKLLTSSSGCLRVKVFSGSDILTWWMIVECVNRHFNLCSIWKQMWWRFIKLNLKTYPQFLSVKMFTQITSAHNISSTLSKSSSSGSSSLALYVFSVSLGSLIVSAFYYNKCMVP